tara:strand:+ start:36 stop:431 length:396 start_codon:yes stop_codon:yes gene_type:complete
MSQYKRGDIATLVSYNVISAASAVGPSEMPLRLKVRKAKVLKSGNKQMTIDGRLGNQNIPLGRVGKPMEGIFKNTYIIVVPKGEEASTYIENAKESMRKSLDSAKINVLKGLEFIDKQAAIEDEWLEENED